MNIKTSNYDRLHNLNNWRSINNYFFNHISIHFYRNVIQQRIMSNKEYTKNVEKAVTEFRRKRIGYLKRKSELQSQILIVEKDLKKELNDICDKYNVNSSYVSRIVG